MTWAIGICRKCHYCRPDWSGGIYYSVFRVRRRRFSLLRMRYIREWTWVCDGCISQVQAQRLRNRTKRADRV